MVLVPPHALLAPRTSLCTHHHHHRLERGEARSGANTRQETQTSIQSGRRPRAPQKEEEEYGVVMGGEERVFSDYYNTQLWLISLFTPWDEGAGGSGGAYACTQSPMNGPTRERVETPWPDRLSGGMADGLSGSVSGYTSLRRQYSTLRNRG